MNLTLTSMWGNWVTICLCCEEILDYLILIENYVKNSFSNTFVHSSCFAEVFSLKPVVSLRHQPVDSDFKLTWRHTGQVLLSSPGGMSQKSELFITIKALLESALREDLLYVWAPEFEKSQMSDCDVSHTYSRLSEYVFARLVCFLEVWSLQRYCPVTHLAGRRKKKKEGILSNYGLLQMSAVVILHLVCTIAATQPDAVTFNLYC